MQQFAFPGENHSSLIGHFSEWRNEVSKLQTGPGQKCIETSRDFFRSLLDEASYYEVHRLKLNQEIRN